MSRVAAWCLVLAACSTTVDVAPATSTTSSTSLPSTTIPLTTIPPTTLPPGTGAPAQPAAEPPSKATAPSTTHGPATPRHEGTPMLRFSVEVGEGVDLTRDEFARFVVDTLSDGRSWIGRGAGFELVDEGGDFTMIVALPEEVDVLCAPLQTVGRFSCARNGWIAFNSLRWFGATEDWPADLETYRRYLVNHEVGHYILGPSHDSCPGPGEIAPVMMQQTKGLDGCLPNGWVDPGPPE